MGMNEKKIISKEQNHNVAKKLEYDLKIIITLKAQKHNVESRKRMELIKND